MTPAHLSASAEQQRLPTSHGSAPPVVNFIAHTGSAEHRPGADTVALLGLLLRLEHGPDRQQPQPRPGLGPPFRAPSIVELLAEHLVAAAQAQHPTALAVRLADGPGHARYGVVHDVRHGGLR